MGFDLLGLRPPEGGEGSLEWLEEILTRVESDRIEHDEAVALLKQWV